MPLSSINSIIDAVFHLLISREFLQLAGHSLHHQNNNVCNKAQQLYFRKYPGFLFYQFVIRTAFRLFFQNNKEMHLCLDSLWRRHNIRGGIEIGTYVVIIQGIRVWPGEAGHEKKSG